VETARRILLIRHGRSAHVQNAGWFDAAGFERWRADADTAGILSTDAPPPALVATVAGADALVSSDLPRAIESAERLAPHQHVERLPLLRESVLRVPALPGLRLPIPAWDALTHAHWGTRILRGTDASGVELKRAADAAAWLQELTARAPTVAVVTHGVFRRLVAAQLERSGWSPPPSRSYAHWSAWELRR
jgi:broad specificity phosphatase PhoE